MNKTKTPFSAICTIIIVGCGPAHDGGTPMQSNRKEIVNIECFEVGLEKPMDLTLDIKNNLQSEMSKLDFEVRKPFVRELLVGPDCSFKVYFSDGSCEIFRLLGRRILTDDQISVSWDFPHGPVFLSKLGM